MSSSLSTPAPVSRRRGSLARRLSLKPYGDELLTSSAEFWIFSARLIIVTMACAEALAWGYMGYLMSQAYPFLAAAIAAVFIFILVWIIDSSFMTLDLARSYYERALTGREESRTKERLKLIAGVGARIAIVTASLVITAPFLGQAIFAGDVREEMTRRNAAAVAQQRQQVEQPFAGRIAELQSRQGTLEQQRVQEAAGVGPSGRYGRGPALETIERQLLETRNEVRAAEEARAAALARFDGLSREQLQQQYGIQFLSPGVRSSGELLGDMLASSQFTRAELAIRAFLAFLFLGLLILKFFQPKSVAVYFNERLHSLYDEYRKGLFDAWLPEAERASAGGDIDPLRFEDWCIETYPLIRSEEGQRRRAATESRMHEHLVDQWQRLEQASRGELDPLRQRYDMTVARMHELEAELHRARASASTVADELKSVEEAAASMLHHLGNGGMSGGNIEQKMAAARELDDRRRALQLAIQSGAGAIESNVKRLEMLRSDAAALQREMEAKEAVIADAQQRVSEQRIKASRILAGTGDA